MDSGNSDMDKGPKQPQEPGHLTCLYIVEPPVWLKTAFTVLVQEGGGIGARLVRGKGK